MDVFAPVAHLLPRAPARILDVGAGTGRDAAWFARQGHSVVAAEPVDELREAGRALHSGARVRFIADALPDLVRTRGMGEAFDLIVACAVWQHVRPEDRAASLAALSSLTAPGAALLLSIRHGAGAPDRPCFPASPDETIALAAAAGLRLSDRREAESVQPANRANGVRWTWLALRRDAQ